MPRIKLDRRKLIGLAGIGLAEPALWSYVRASAEIRTVGVLMGLANDSEAKARAKVFEQGLAGKGWISGQNLRIEYRYGAGDSGLIHDYVREFVSLRPDVILGHSTPVVAALVQATRTIPIVFVVVADPVGSGFAASIAHPGGNVTGFTNLDSTITGKLLTILKQTTPDLTRVALLFNPDTVARGGLFYAHPFELVAPAFAVKPIIVQVHDGTDIERQMTALGSEPGAGVIVMPDNFTTVHRHLIISLAAQLRIPTVYPYRYFVEEGGLISYGVDVMDLFRRASDYVDRVLRGADPADLPIQAPTKFELVINLKTARALGLPISQVLLAGADDLID
jgi:putative tryptophan/tyrosine transport system substrate-binding protein